MDTNLKTQKTKSGKFLGMGVLTAFAASLCCITPVLALFSGASGIASTFSWMEPFRPYLIGLTVVVLAFAWYQKLKPRTQEEIDCACEEDEKPSFWQSKKFLGIVTIFAAVMLAFPYYSSIFYPDTNTSEIAIVESNNVEETIFNVSGMTCESCNLHVEHAVTSLQGIISAKADYVGGTVVVRFDKSKVSKEQIKEAINGTGYKVVE